MAYKWNFGNDIENKIFKSFHNLYYGHFIRDEAIYKERKKILKRYRQYMFDKEQTETTRQKLLDEREYNYDLKDKMLYDYIRCKETTWSYLSIREKSKQARQIILLNIQKKYKKLNTLLIKRLKQQYLKVISPLLLPHDLENLIIEYLI
jgi:hypothetical protein